MKFPPLVYDPNNDPTTKQLQPGEQLKIPLSKRVDRLELQMIQLITLLQEQGIEIPEI